MQWCTCEFSIQLRELCIAAHESILLQAAPVIRMIIITINDSTTDLLPAFATHHVPLFCFVYLTPGQTGKPLISAVAILG